jgi:hypothetical protein
MQYALQAMPFRVLVHHATDQVAVAEQLT